MGDSCHSGPLGSTVRAGGIARFKGISLPGLFASALPAGLRFGGAFLQLLVTVLIARFLGVKEAGIYFFWVALFSEAGQIATFGLDRLAVQQLPRLERTAESISEFLAPLRVTALTIAAGLALVLCFYAVLSGGPEARPTWWFPMVFLAVAGVTMCFINAESMTGLSHPVLAILYKHTVPTVFILVTLALTGPRLTADIAMLAYAAAFFLVGFGAMLGPGFRGLGEVLRVPTKQQWKDFLRLGSPIFLNTLFCSLSFVIPLAVLEWTRTSDEVALLTTSFRIILLFGVLATAIYSLQMPDLSRAAHARDVPEVFRIFRSAAWRGVLILGVPLIISFVFASPVMAIFGEGFEAGAVGLQIMMAFGFGALFLGPALQLLL
ncbi:MAG: lipopolysaccharide biosynthesis protein, partial [Verrucomicrobiota bacterium]